jgi:secondary thiamine-phosphate synthase enzyme
MQQAQATLRIDTPGRGLHEVTGEVRRAVSDSGITTGLCLVYCQHTSCSLVIQENADPSARHDLERWLERLAPDGDPANTHTAEGPDDMPSHLRAAVTKTSESIPVVDGRLALGTWQGIFLAEHRLRPHARRLIIHITGT